MNMNSDLQTKSCRILAIPVRTMWFWLFAALLTFNLVVIGFDLYPRVERKLARRNIGQIPATAFPQQVRNATLRLFIKKDQPLLSDENRLRIIDYLMEPQDFIFRGGLLGNGLVNWCQTTNDPEAFAAIKHYADEMIDIHGHFYNPPDSVNDGAIGCSLVFLAGSTKEERYRKACDELASYFISYSARHSGLVPYIAHKDEELMLIDTIGLMCPFLAQYSKMTGKPEALDLAIRQIDEFMAHSIDFKSGIPFHGYNRRCDDYLVGVVGWGRGLGWLVTGVGKVLTEIPSQDPRRERLVAYSQRIIKVAIQTQRPDGVWGNMITVSSSLKDSSATAMITVFLIQCRRQEVVGPEIDANISRAVESLRRNTRKNGVLDFAQGDVIDLNRHSRNWGATMYGQGALLSALVELANLKLKQPPPIQPQIQ